MTRNFAVLAVLLIFAFAAQTFAAGTPAGSTITNKAYGNYKDKAGNDMTQVESNQVSTTVAEKYGVDVASNDAKSVANDAFVDYAVTITNTGNGTEIYDLNTASSSTTGSSSFSEVMYLDADRDGVKDAGENTVVTATSALEADSVYYIVVRVSVSSSTGGDERETIVEAEDRTAATTSDIATLTTTVTEATLSGTLTPSPTSGDPGATITYTLVISETGNEAAYNSIITIPVPANADPVANSLTINGVTQTDDGADGDSTSWNGTDTWTVDLATIANGASNITITYQLTIESGASASDVVSALAKLDSKNSGGTSYTQVEVDAGSDVDVNQSYSFSTTITPDSTWANAGDDSTFILRIWNQGNGADTYDLTESSSEGYTWTYYEDANFDGTADGAALTTTGSVAADDSTWILAVVTVTSTAAVDDVDDTDITVTGGNSATSVRTAVTTVIGPFLVLTKSVSPGGDQPPGTDLTYTVLVSNTGDGPATSVVITDAIPANTTYQAGTLYIDSGSGFVSKTDGTGDDEASVSGGTATFNVGGLAVGGSVSVKFTTQID